MAKHDDSTIARLLADPRTERQAFAMLVETYGETLYWAIRRIVIDHDDANDVLQNTFLKAWQATGSFQARAKLSTWLHRIAVNESLDFLRHKKNRASVSGKMEAAGKLPSDGYFDGDEAQALLQEAVASLPDVQRTVFTLRYFSGMKYSEISRVLDTTEGALKASYHIAVKKITAHILNHHGA